MRCFVGQKLEAGRLSFLLFSSASFTLAAGAEDGSEVESKSSDL